MELRKVYKCPLLNSGKIVSCCYVPLYMYLGTCIYIYIVYVCINRPLAHWIGGDTSWFLQTSPSVYFTSFHSP